jgi:diguanylate cyclase (GGDEF)-like protein
LTRSSRVAHRLLAGLILWLPITLCATVPPVSPADGTAAGNTMAFDQLIARLDNDDIALNNQASIERTLDRLRAWLPPNDAYRQRRYEYMVCFLAFDNDVKGGYAYAGRGIEHAHQAGDAEAEANFHFCRGLYQGMLTAERDALPEYEAGIRIARHLENSRLVADGLTWRGSAQSLLGEQARALIDFLEAQRLYEAEHMATAAQSNLVNIAVIYRRLGDYDKAGQYLHQSMAAAEGKGDRQEQMVIDLQLGFLATERGDPAAAIAPLQQALAIARATGSRESTGSALLALAQVSNGRHQYAEALRQLASAATEFKAVADRSNTGMLALQSAEAHAGLGQHALAAREFAVAEANVRHSSNMRYMAELYLERSKNDEALGSPAAALADLRLKMKADEALARMAKTQLTTMMSYQFDTERRELENRKLAADKVSKEQQLEALKRIRGWQRVAIALAGMLLLLMVGLAWKQLRRGRRLHRLAHTDALTGAANRRHIERVLHRAVDDAQAERRQLSVIMLDVDHFKTVNDSHGHQAGDEVLVQIVQACQGALRQFDRLGRMGGEEFLVVLPDSDLEAGLQVAERLRAGVASLQPVIEGALCPLSISLGVAQLQPAEKDMAALVRRADAALYRAKAGGRNRVEAAS